MKTLYIVRHAKSSWENSILSDHDRPLLPAGIKKTKRIIKYLQERKPMPDLLLSSSAVRAVETAKLIAGGIGYPVDRIETSKSLYHASSDDIFAELFALDNSIGSVMIFGHNPAFTYFVNEYLDPTILNLPTSGVVCVEFECEKWENLTDSKFQVKFAVYPRMLK